MSTTVHEANAFNAAAMLPHADKKITAIKSPINPLGKYSITKLKKI
jgi:hypothetical protein